MSFNDRLDPDKWLHLKDRMAEHDYLFPCAVNLKCCTCSDKWKLNLDGHRQCCDGVACWSILSINSWRLKRQRLWPNFVENINPFTPKFKKYILPAFWREMYKWGAGKLLGSIIIFHLSKLRKAKFFILHDIILFLVRLQAKIEIDHSCEWKG